MMTNNDFSLLNTVPTVLRARGFRLYTQGGHADQGERTNKGKRRLVDLWLNGGAAILGHTPPSMLRELKNTASRGLYAPFPHFLEARFIKALSRIFPGRSFRLYAVPPPELETMVKNGEAGLWRPYIDPKSSFEVADNATPLIAQDTKIPGILIPGILIPVLPGIQGWRSGLPLGLCVVAAKSEDKLAKLPPGDFLPPVLLAVAARGVYDLIAAPERANPALPKIAKALQKNPFWRRTGIYLFPNENQTPEDWSALFKKFLDAGFLLPPVPWHPLILPGEFSAGEEAKLAAVLG